MTTRTPRAIRLPTTSRYEFQEPIGSGGMGTVYRALDRRDGQLVAIKVMKYKLSENPTLHQRLAREFRAASELEHPVRSAFTGALMQPLCGRVLACLDL